MGWEEEEESKGDRSVTMVGHAKSALQLGIGLSSALLSPIRGYPTPHRLPSVTVQYSLSFKLGAFAVAPIPFFPAFFPTSCLVF